MILTRGLLGYAPTDQPEIVVSVLVEHGKHGSSGAGPIAEMIVSYLKKYDRQVSNRDY
ncbi:MAG: hypothetical protein R2860_08275 [Desulfobacterales bacterium]